MAVINKYINLSLVENPVFLVLAGSVMLMAVGVPHCLFFLPSHVKTVGLMIRYVHINHKVTNNQSQTTFI